MAEEKLYKTEEVVALLQELLMPGIRLGTDACLALWKIANHYNITTKKGIYENRGLIGPVIVKNDEERQYFKNKIESLKPAAKKSEIGTGGIKMPNLGKENARKNWLLSGIAATVIVGLLLVFLLYKPTQTDAGKQLIPRIDTSRSRHTSLTSSNVRNIALPSINPLFANPRILPVNFNSYRIITAALSVILVLMAAILASVALNYFLIQKRLKIIDGKYPRRGSKAGEALQFLWPSLQHYISFQGPAAQLAVLLSLKQKQPSSQIDIAATINITAAKAGFPSFQWLSIKQKGAYLILIDTGEGNSQQADLIESLCEYFEKKGVFFYKYYYSSNPFKVSRKKSIESPIALETLVKKHTGSGLIIFGNGYGFTSIFSMAGDNTALNKIIALIKRTPQRALITPVPRNNWASSEKELRQWFPLFPLTGDGLAKAADVMSLPSEKVALPHKDGDRKYCTYPLPNNMNEYEAFFEKDDRLLVWLCCLAVAGIYSWAVTLAVGEILENDLYGDDEKKLVTYDNLYKLTSVEWMQTGMLDGAHRQEMATFINLHDEAVKIKNIVSRGLVDFMENLSTEGSSFLQKQKNINIALQKQWASNAGTLEIAYLQRQKMLSHFDSKWIKAQGKLMSMSVFKNHRWWFLAGSFITCIALYFLMANAIPVQRLLFNKFIPPATDSFAYYNDQAAVMMQLPITGSNNEFERIREFLGNAARFDSGSNILRGNYQALIYFTAKFCYEHSQYREAILELDTLVGEKILPPQTQASQLFRDSLGIYALYAQAACYYNLPGPNDKDSACYIQQQIKQYTKGFPGYSIFSMPSFCDIDKLKPQVNSPANAPKSIQLRFEIFPRKYLNPGDSETISATVLSEKGTIIDSAIVSFSSPGFNFNTRQSRFSHTIGFHYPLIDPQPYYTITINAKYGKLTTSETINIFWKHIVFIHTDGKNSYQQALQLKKCIDRNNRLYATVLQPVNAGLGYAHNTIKYFNASYKDTAAMLQICLNQIFPKINFPLDPNFSIPAPTATAEIWLYDNTNVSASGTVPYLVKAEFVANTTSDDKDADTKVRINVYDDRKTQIANGEDVGELYNNNSKNVLSLKILNQAVTKEQCKTFIVEISQTTVGNDTWIFNGLVILTFSDGTTLEAFKGNIRLVNSSSSTLLSDNN